MKLEMVAFQRKCADTSKYVAEVTMATQTILRIPKELNELLVVPFFYKQEPQFKELIDESWYIASDPFNLEAMPKALLHSRLED